MKFIDFKRNLMFMAEDETVPLSRIEQFLFNFFWDKGVPVSQFTHSFVDRCSINNPGELFKNVSRCSYPPDKSKIKIQRANYSGQQVFYCSPPSDTDEATASLTCIVETAWEHIEDWSNSRTYMTLSRWRIKRNLELFVLPFCAESCDKNRDFKTVKDGMTQLINNQHSNAPATLEALEFISEAFCSKENKSVFYRITSTFYNALLRYERMFGYNYDGLIYPSANTHGAGMNVVLKKQLIDNETLFCDLTMLYSMQRMPNNPKHINIMTNMNEVIPEPDGTLRNLVVV